MKQFTFIQALLGVTLLALPLPLQAADLAYMSKLTSIDVQPQIPGTTVTLALRGAVKPVVTALDRAVQVELKGTYLTPAKQRIPVGTGGIAEVFAYQYDKDTVRVRLLPTEGSARSLFKRMRVENEAGVMRLMVVGTTPVPAISKASEPTVKPVARPAITAVAPPAPVVAPTVAAVPETVPETVSTPAADTPMAKAPVAEAPAVTVEVVPPADSVEVTPAVVVDAAVEPQVVAAAIESPNMKALIRAREDALAALAKLVGSGSVASLAQGGGSPALPELEALAALENPEGAALSPTGEVVTEAATDEVIVTALADTTRNTISEAPADVSVETAVVTLAAPVEPTTEPLLVASLASTEAVATTGPVEQAAVVVNPVVEPVTPSEPMPVATETSEAVTTPLTRVVKAPSLWQSGARMAAGLAIVLALLYGGLALLRRFKGMPIGGRVPIRVLGSAAVGARQNIVVVDVDGRRLVVGVGPNGMARLGDLGAGSDPDQTNATRDAATPADEAVAETAPTPPNSPFSKALQEADDEQAGEAIARASRNLQRHLKLMQSRNV